MKELHIYPAETLRLWPQRIVGLYEGRLLRGWRFLLWDWMFW